jgi:two-component system, NarL family, nitrate/nitrite response regulator NarL
VSKRCLIADDHPALTAAVTAFVAGSGFEIVGPASDGRRALELAREQQPELALVDYRMPQVSGLELLHELREASPGTRVAVYTGDADADLAREAFDAGARAVLLKGSTLAEVVRALEAIQAGRSYLDPSLSGGAGRPGNLTRRELDVLELLAEGLQHEEIGRRLGISSETVRTHLRKASHRLGAATRTHAVATALRLGLIQ